MVIKYSNQAWYYRVRLSLYLVAVIWAIGIIVPFLIRGFASVEIRGWVKGIPGYPYPGDFMMLCFYWEKSVAHDVANLFLAGYLVLGLLGVVLTDIPPANPLKAWKKSYKDWEPD